LPYHKNDLGISVSSLYGALDNTSRFPRYWLIPKDLAFTVIPKSLSFSFPKELRLSHSQLLYH